MSLQLSSYLPPYNILPVLSADLFTSRVVLTDTLLFHEYLFCCAIVNYASIECYCAFKGGIVASTFSCTGAAEAARTY